MAYSNSRLATYTKISPYRNSPRSKPITKITIHHMAGNLSIEKCGSVFQSRPASANYGVGSDGRIGMYVEEKDRSWASASSDNDNRAVTIEVANIATGGQWPVSDKALASLVELCADICRRNGIARLNYTGYATGNLTRHNMFIATTCPGPYLQNKFPWIAAEVNKRLNKKEEVDMTEAEVRALVAAESKKAAEAAVVAYQERLAKMPASGWAEKFWRLAIKDEIFDGGMPRAPLTREQYAAILMRMKDAKCPGWAKEAVQWAIDNGIMSGDGKELATPDNVRAQDNLTRAELAVMLQRFAESDAEIELLNGDNRKI